jgi:hypothetical protein
VVFLLRLRLHMLWALELQVFLVCRLRDRQELVNLVQEQKVD